MARNQAGGINKFLNFIGLVDDRAQDDRYDEYNPANEYGRANAYQPNRPRNDGRANAQPRRSIPAQGGRSNPGNARRGYGEEDRYNQSRRSARFEDVNPDPIPAQRAARSRSRFEETDELFDEPMSAPQPQQRPQRNSSRTVMFSLTNLKDANMVITALVKGNTIIMTLATNDERVTERIVDTLSGAVFALDATIRKASAQTYLLAPKNVNVKAAYEVEDQF